METVVSRFVCFGVVVGAPTAFDGETNACDTPTATRSRRATVLFIMFICVISNAISVRSSVIVPHLATPAGHGPRDDH